MSTAKTRTFRSGNSEAVRLPKDAAFGEDIELIVVRSGDVITMYPAVASIPEMITQLQRLPVPATLEQRDVELLPERDGIWGMAYVPDTKVAIHLRDGDDRITRKVAPLDDAIMMSVVTKVELEGGVYRDPAIRRYWLARLDALLSAIPALAFDDASATM